MLVGFPAPKLMSCTLLASFIRDVIKLKPVFLGETIQKAIQQRDYSDRKAHVSFKRLSSVSLPDSSGYFSRIVHLCEFALINVNVHIKT